MFIIFILNQGLIFAIMSKQDGITWFCLNQFLINFPFRFLVRVSYLEIYNENVRDLLGKDQNAKLEVCGLYCQKQLPGTLFFKIPFNFIFYNNQFWIPCIVIVTYDFSDGFR